MSRKQRLESLASLGQLSDKDVRSIQHGLVQKHTRNMATLGWITIAAFEAIVLLGLIAFIWYGFWMLHT